MKTVQQLIIAAVLSLAGALQAADIRLPEKVTLPSLVDVTGKEHTLESGKPVVLAWTARDCPMAKVYAPRLRALATEMQSRGVQFFLIDSSSDATPESLRKLPPSAGPLICDAHGKLARLAGARSTTDAVLLDGDGRVVYRGAVDDQYGYRRATGLGAGTYRKDAPAQQFLRDAVEAVLAGQSVPTAATDPMGCLLEWTPAPAAAEAKDKPVFYGDVEKIFRDHCTDCHQSGGYAPFSLVQYENARRRARMIAEVVGERRMPPWSASPEHGHFSNDPSLAPAEIERIQQWVEAGMPAGKKSKALPPIPPHPEWEIGKPDVIYETESFDVAAEGQLPYRYVRIPTHLTEDRWVDATQIISTSPEVVHHVLIFIEENGPAPAGSVRPWTPSFDIMSLLEGSKPEEAMTWGIRMAPYMAKDLTAGGGGGLNGSFATTLAAGRGLIYPPGRAKLLPAGATIVMQIHYTPDGTAHQSKTRLGIHFAKQPPTEPVDSRSLATVAFMIPPGVAAHEVTATKVMPRDATLLSLRPHMHLRGKSFRYIAEFPDGKSEVLLEVPKWDFEWQVEYVLAKPRLLPKGTRLRAIATYDNSKDNPANPDPSKSVFFGLQSSDEMMIGYFEVVWHDAPKSAALDLPDQGRKL
jgi:mono/diheme cytochrome c family protein